MARATRRAFLQGSVAGGLAVTLGSRTLTASPWSRPRGANDDIQLAIIGLGEVEGVGVGGRGKQLIDCFRRVSGARIVALCDVDQSMLARERKRFAGWQQPVKSYTDMREVFEDRDVDAVVIATPNHWHALATIWACQAGKDVYVEKPASYSLWEGRQMVAAARQHERIVQTGTQARSSDISIQAAEYLRSGQLGRPQYAHAIVYRRREGIGKVDGPQPVPASVDYDLWLGPAPKAGLMRRNFHYDWHWVWTTGNGEIGNNGVHQLDRCRWMLGQDVLPARAVSVGGRFKFDDDGQTPNTQVAFWDYQPAPIICEVRNLPAESGSRKMDTFRSLTTGIIIQCEDGAVISGRDNCFVQDKAGNKLTEFQDRNRPEEQRTAHQVNFIKAVRSRQAGDLTAEIADGHRSAALCHMANVSHRLGGQAEPDAMREAIQGNSQWADAMARLHSHLEANGVDPDDAGIVLGPWITLDPRSEQYVGEFAEQASALSRRDFRKPFVVPAIV